MWRVWGVGPTTVSKKELHHCKGHLVLGIYLMRGPTWVPGVKVSMRTAQACALGLGQKKRPLGCSAATEKKEAALLRRPCQHWRSPVCKEPQVHWELVRGAGASPERVCLCAREPGCPRPASCNMEGSSNQFLMHLCVQQRYQKSPVLERSCNRKTRTRTTEMCSSMEQCWDSRSPYCAPPQVLGSGLPHYLTGI